MKFNIQTVRVIFTEFLGTFMIVYFSCWTFLLFKLKEISLFQLGVINGLVITSMTWACLSSSGSHFNPVISVLKAFLQQHSIKTTLVYVITQILASFFAGLMALLTSSSAVDKNGDSIITYPHPNFQYYTTFTIFFMEFIFSFFYILIYCATVFDKRAPSNIFGFAIGGVFILASMCIGHHTGACLNPMRTLGPQITSGEFKNIWLYLLADFFGGLFGGFYYEFFLKDISDDIELLDVENDKIE